MDPDQISPFFMIYDEATTIKISRSDDIDSA